MTEEEKNQKLVYDGLRSAQESAGKSEAKEEKPE